MLTLRPYQQQAVEAVYDHLRSRDDNPCVVIPTGGGKTPVLATICRDAVNQWNGRVLVLAHVKELLEQTADKLRLVCPEVDFGIYSAGLKQRDTNAPVIVAGIQSVFRRACDLGPFDLILVDEAHMIPAGGEGRYRQFLDEALVVNPAVRVIGLTATPYRLKSGMICTSDHFLNHICFEVGVGELIREGFLSPLTTCPNQTQFDTTGVQVRSGEFVASEIERVMDEHELVRAACQEIIENTSTRRSVLIFAAGVDHARHVQTILHDEHHVECGFVSGETPLAERDQTLAAFRDGSLKYLVNVNVLTTGFDAPAIDCVVLLRPTMSAGLYYQMVGRGFRLSPGKADCLVLDFGGNVERHGPVDALTIKERSKPGGEAPQKTCPACKALVAAGFAVCAECGHFFPPPERERHDPQASQAGILSDQFSDECYPVQDVMFSVHRKHNAPETAKPTMRVQYRLGLAHWQSEYLCFEHDGFPRRKAEQWWQARSPDPIPATVEEAVTLAEAGALCPTESITVRSIPGERFDRIVDYELGPWPEAVAWKAPVDLDEVPF